jgi:hypothetical protein
MVLFYEKLQEAEKSWLIKNVWRSWLGLYKWLSNANVSNIGKINPQIKQNKL